MTGRTLGEYTVTRLLGRGGMGEVWEGYDPDLDRHVAIKIILPHLATDPTFHERLRGEARLVAALRHQNIVQLYDFDMVDGQAIMVMEFLAGGSLRERLTYLRRMGQRMPLAAAIELLEAAAAGLDYAHARGAVHRDLKPGNMLFTHEGLLVVGDFGIAKIVNAESTLINPTRAEAGTVLGTPAYMSPEQAAGGALDHRSDLYSLGIVLYELVTGRVPFQGNSPAAILTQQIHHDPPAPRTFNPQVDVAVEMVLLQALAKEPDARFASATAMVQALRRAAHLTGEATEEETGPGAVVPPLPAEADGRGVPTESPTLVNTPRASQDLPPPAPQDAPTIAQDAPTIAVEPDHPTIMDQRQDRTHPAA